MDEVYDYSMPDDGESGQYGDQGKKHHKRRSSEEKQEKRKVKESRDTRWPFGIVKQPKLNIEDSLSPRAIDTASANTTKNKFS